jgi:hypothetical protein
MNNNDHNNDITINNITINDNNSHNDTVTNPLHQGIFIIIITLLFLSIPLSLLS